jgi:hypothetical protein
MPLFITELPIVEKLPQTLYGGSFDLQVIKEHKTGIYMFHDKKWFADLRHMLGWSREIIHSLKGNWMRDIFQSRPLRPDWIHGHAFQRVTDTSYRISGKKENAVVAVHILVEWAEFAQDALEKADIHIDQWGSTTHEEWRDAIGKHLDNKKHPMIQEMRRTKNDIEVHTMLANHGNALHHGEYPA